MESIVSVNLFCAGSVMALALAQAAPAYAQVGEDLEGSSGYGFEEIVVTAQKRSENIRDVPISITALTANDLEKSGVSNVVELTAVVPGLKMDRVGGVILPAIRGISTFSTTGGVEPNVAMYIDNVYIGSSAGSLMQLPDVSRVDVLKGPQGTLFGRNATGGAIQIFTKDPYMDAFGGNVSVSYGNFDTLVLKGFLSAPLVVDKLAVSVSGYRETADNYNKNLTPEVPLQDTDNFTIRGKVLFTPTDSTRILFSAAYVRQADPSTLLFSPIDGITVAKGIPGAIYPTKPYEIASNVPLPSRQKGKLVSLQLNQETPLGDLTVIGAWKRTYGYSVTTATAFAYPDPYTGIHYAISGNDTSKQVEIDFASRKFGDFSFVVGANYYQNRSSADPSNILPNTPTSSFNLSVFGGQTAKAYAFFGEATYEFTEKLSVVGGIRYSSEKRGVHGSILPGTVAEGDGPMYDWASRNFSNVDYKVSLRYEISPDANVYFTHSTGFRSGNFDTFSIPFGQSPTSCAATPGLCATPVSVEPETLTAYEVGVKAEPTDWLRVNGALYKYKVKDIQILSFRDVCLTGTCPPDPTTPTGTLSNAASTSIYGAEVDVDVRVTNELRVQGSVSILDATFADYDGATWNVPAPGGLGLVQTPIMSAAGKQVPRAPKATLSLTATYTKELPAGVVSLTANGYATERVYFDVGNVFSQPSYATLGLRASLSPASIPGLTASVWGNNLTNETVILSTFLNSNGALASYAPPRTYGVTVGYKF